MPLFARIIIISALDESVESGHDAVLDCRRNHLVECVNTRGEIKHDTRAAECHHAHHAAASPLTHARRLSPRAAADVMIRRHVFRR